MLAFLAMYYLHISTAYEGKSHGNRRELQLEEVRFDHSVRVLTLPEVIVNLETAQTTL